MAHGSSPGPSAVTGTLVGKRDGIAAGNSLLAEGWTAPAPVPVLCGQRRRVRGCPTENTETVHRGAPRGPLL